MQVQNLNWTPSDLLEITDVKACRDLAEEGHRGVKRKWSDVPYLAHPERIFKRICEYQHPTIQITLLQRIRMAKAAWLHDVPEDCKHIPLKRVEDVSGDAYQDIMLLTNPSKNFPKLPRADRKEIDRKHYATLDEVAPLYAWEVRILKMIDRDDNLNDMGGCPDKRFLRLYAQESRQLVKELAIADEALAKKLIEASYRLEKGR